MDKLKNTIITDIIDINDIPSRHRSSELEDKIQKTLETIPEGKAGIVDVGEIKFRHLAGKISQMIEDKKIPENVRVIRRGETFYLAKVKMDKPVLGK